MVALVRTTLRVRANKRRAQEVRDRERRGVDLVALAGLAALDPGDRLDLVGGQRAAGRLQRRVLDAVDRRDVRRDAAQGEIAPPFRLRRVVDRLAQAVFPVRVQPVLEPVERLAHRRQHLEDALVGRDRILVAGDARERLLQPPHPFVELGVVRAGDRVGAMQLAHHAVDRDRRERRGQRGGRVLLGLVRLVDDHEIVGWEQRAAAGEVEEEQRVVDDHDVGEARGVAFREEVAVGEPAAVLAHAVVGVGVERLPVVAARRELELGAVAGLGSLGPRPQPFQRERRRDQARSALLLELGAGTGSGCGL